MVRTPSAPVDRPRIVERLLASSTFPIVLVIAPAGYGKSIALRQYLRTLDSPNVYFCVRAEHRTLLGFLRGFTSALATHAPYAADALADAYERNANSETPGPDLARWLQAHLDGFSGTVALDDLHTVAEEEDIAHFLAALIEQTKGSVQWILSSRTSAGLPTATWLAYRDADLPIGERDLSFTLDEARAAAQFLESPIGDEELVELLRLTDGWPAAISFALRSATRSSEFRNLSALTRDMIYKLLAEQVYSRLSDAEREVLDVATALPTIDISVLEKAGFDRALGMLERLRERTGFIQEESAGIYHCHDLFREFLRHQAALAGKQSQRNAYERAARALEANADYEHAITAYVAAESRDDVLRLLERHGFRLLERARGDVVAAAIESLGDRARQENAYALALQGALLSTSGKFARAESLFRRALARANGDRDVSAAVSLRLASLLGNQGADIASILMPISTDQGQRRAYRAEALALVAAQEAMSSDSSGAAAKAAAAEALLSEADEAFASPRILHNLGIVYRHLGDARRAIARLTHASDLAIDLHHYGLASRTFAVLSNLALHDQDDVDSQLGYATRAAECAVIAGDTFALSTALLQMLSAYMRRSEIASSLAVENRLMRIGADARTRDYVSIFRAVRFLWAGQFAEARELFESCWSKMSPGADHIFVGALYAVSLSVDSRRDAALQQIDHIVEATFSVKPFGKFDRRIILISQIMCAVAEFLNRRFSRGERLLRRVAKDDAVVFLAESVATGIAIALRGQRGSTEDTAVQIERLKTTGYGAVAGVLAAVLAVASSRADKPLAVLTESERRTLRSLADGLTPKEIAAGSGRSVYTVRTHIANAIAKLECNGRLEAIEMARLRELI